VAATGLSGFLRRGRIDADTAAASAKFDVQGCARSAEKAAAAVRRQRTELVIAREFNRPATTGHRP